MSPPSFFLLFTSWQCNLPKWQVAGSRLWLRCPDDVCAVMRDYLLFTQRGISEARSTVILIHCFSLHSEDGDARFFFVSSFFHLIFFFFFKVEMPRPCRRRVWCQVKDTSSWKCCRWRVNAIQHMKASFVSLLSVAFDSQIFSAHIRRGCLQEQTGFYFSPHWPS